MHCYSSWLNFGFTRTNWHRNIRYIRPLYFIWLISACSGKSPKIDLRPYIAPYGAFNNKAYRYINKLDGSPEFWLYKTKPIADGIRLTESEYNKDSVTGYLSTWKISEKGMSYVETSLFMKNTEGQVRKLVLQCKNNASYDWAQDIRVADPFFTMKTSCDMGELNPTQNDLMLASTLDESLLHLLDSFTLPNNKTYYNCIETLCKDESKLVSKSGRLRDKEIISDDVRTIYAKGIGAIYIGYKDARNSVEHKAFYLDTTIDASKFTPFDR
jgi:hypothetical protein